MTPEKIERDRTAGTPGQYYVHESQLFDAERYVPNRVEVAVVMASDYLALTAERDAALAGAMRVKPLVWRRIKTHGGDCFDASGAGVEYRVGVWGGQIKVNAIQGVNFPTFEAAQAAAQADHEARIRAAIEPAEPSISAAESILARLDPEALRPILSRLANHTPNSCYYSKDFGESMRALPEKEATEGGKMPPMEQGLMFVAATAGGRLSVGDKLAAEFTSIMHGAQDIGSFRVTVERIATKENSDE